MGRADIDNLRKVLAAKNYFSACSKVDNEVLVRLSDWRTPEFIKSVSTIGDRRQPHNWHWLVEQDSAMRML